MAARLAVSPLTPFVLDEFEISKSLIGVALTGMWLAYALTQYPSGVLGEQHGEKKVILLSLGGVCVMSVLLGLTPVFELFFVGCILLGGFAGLEYAAATTFLTRKFDRDGRVIGIHAFGAPFAGLVVPVLITWIGVRYGWRLAVISTVAVSLPVFVLFYSKVGPTAPTNPTQSFTDSVNLDIVTELIRQPPISFSIGIAVVGEFYNQGLISFLPVFLVQYHGYSATASGALFSLFFLGSALGSVTIGSVSDRFGQDLTIAGCLLLVVVGIAVILTPFSLAPLLGVTLLAFGTCLVIVVQTRFLDRMTDGDRGTEFGLVRTVYMILGSLGSVTVGILAESFGWTVAFGLLAALCVMSMASIAVNRWLQLGL